nr:MAG TPA: hypothetical protein [Caudoviricetes sp.]
MTHPCIRTCMLRINILSKILPVTVYIAVAGTKVYVLTYV